MLTYFLGRGYQNAKNEWHGKCGCQKSWKKCWRTLWMATFLTLQIQTIETLNSKFKVSIVGCLQHASRLNKKFKCLELSFSISFYELGILVYQINMQARLLTLHWFRPAPLIFFWYTTYEYFSRFITPFFLFLILNWLGWWCLCYLEFKLS